MFHTKRTYEGRTCPRCTVRPSSTSHAYCAPCHAERQREWRKTHPLTPEQRVKMNARCYANVMQKRGHLVPEPCMDCGAPAEKHHPDYREPKRVEWLCRTHHLARHHGR